MNILNKSATKTIQLSSSILKRYLSSIKEGTKLPNSVLYENTPANKVSVHDLFAGKKGIIIGVPGAFTPTCSNSHLPGFIKNIDQVRAKGYQEVICVTVNDAFVTGAWAKDRQAENKVRVLADPSAEFTKAIGMDKNLPPLGGVRSKRYTIIVEDNVVKQVFEEPDGTGATCSLAENVLKKI